VCSGFILWSTCIETLEDNDTLAMEPETKICLNCFDFRSYPISSVYYSANQISSHKKISEQKRDLALNLYQEGCAQEEIKGLTLK
jgi:hypothetical protein